MQNLRNTALDTLGIYPSSILGIYANVEGRSLEEKETVPIATQLDYRN
jgi:hypothetical protein